MEKSLLIFILAFQSLFSVAQTFTSNNGGSIPDGGPMVQFPIAVSNLPSSIDSSLGVTTVCLNITHTYDANLNISLQSPDGTIVNLSIGDGGEGDNFDSTCFNAAATTSISNAGAPFTGTFIPQGLMGSFNNGQNPNGIWNLLIEDTFAVDSGTLINWSITFGNNPPVPFSFTSSNLPIVVINTGGVNIPSEPKIVAFMGIIYNGVGLRNYVTDAFNNYNNKIGIESRGSSSSSFPQTSYNFETRDINGTQKDTTILGMPAEHDWILYAPYDDKTCIRNVLSYDIANKTGHYASRTRYCELVLDGQYKGIYVVMEKVKRNANRVNISKILPTDITGDGLTGGYIIKVDRDDGPGSYWTSSHPALNGSNVNFVHVYPKNGTIVTQQRTYIQNYIDTLENVLAGSSFTDPVNGYRKYISVKSFIDFFILNEVSKNVDGYRLSTFFYKDKQSKGGKLKAGPAWDFNLAWWNADYCDGSLSTGWMYDFSNVCPFDDSQPNFWWKRLLDDSTYTAELKCRWLELRATTLNILNLNNYIDSLAANLDEAQTRHFTVWPILGQYTWPNPSPLPSNYPGEIASLKSWMADRISWMDANLPGTCTTLGMTQNAINEQNVAVYPNPFANSFSINLYLKHAAKLKITVTDMLGRNIKYSNLELTSGANTIEMAIEEANMQKGIYILTVFSEEGTVTKKLTRMN